jgi:hypothetical protein
VDFQAVTLLPGSRSRVDSSIPHGLARGLTAVLAMSAGHPALEQLAAVSAKVALRRDDGGA